MRRIAARYFGSGQIHAAPTPKRLHQFHAELSVAGLSGPVTSGGPLDYNGGPVMTGQIGMVPIFWAPATLQDGTASAFADDYRQAIVQYLNDLDGSRWLHTVTQYYQTTDGTTTYVTDRTRVLRAVIDTDPFPAAGVGCGTYAPGDTNCISDDQLRAEISAVRGEYETPADLHTLYPVFLPPGEEICGSDQNLPGCGPPQNGFCAYHGWFSDPTDAATVIYAAEPFPDGGCAGHSGTPESPDVEGQLILLGHEVAEAATDPTIDGWHSTYEVADLCQENYGDIQSRDPGFYANQQFNGTFYFQQGLWDSVRGDCAQAGPSDQGATRQAFAPGVWTDTTIVASRSQGELVAMRDQRNAGQPVAAVAAADGSRVYWIDAASAQLRAVNEPGMTADQSVQVGVPAHAGSLAISPDGSIVTANGSERSISRFLYGPQGHRYDYGVGGVANDVALVPSGKTVWIASDTGLISFSFVTNKVGTTVPLGGSASGLALSPSGADAYVALPSLHKLVDVSLTTLSVRWTANLLVTGRPAITPDGQHIVVGDQGSGLVTSVSAASGVIENSRTIPTLRGLITDANGDALALSGNSTRRTVTTLAVPALTTSGTGTVEADAALLAPMSQPPIAKLASPIGATPGVAEPFDASGSVDDGYGIASYAWKFGDGTTQTTTTPQTTHAYAKAGSYTVTLTVTSNLAASSPTPVFDGHEYLRQVATTTTQPVTIVPASTPRELAGTISGIATVYETPAGPLVGSTIPVTTGVIDFVVSPDGKTVYVLTRGGHSVSVINLATGAATPSIQFNDHGSALAITPDGKTLWVLANGDRLIPAALPTRVVGRTITIGDDPDAPPDIVDLALSPDGTTAWLADAATSSIYPVDLAAASVGTPIALDGPPSAIAITPDGSRLIVSDGTDGALLPVDTAAAAKLPYLVLDGFPRDVAITPNGSIALAAIASFRGGTAFQPMDIAAGSLGSSTPVTPGSGSFAGASTMTIMPDGRVAYVGAVDDNVIIQVAMSSLVAGDDAVLVGQVGIAQPVPAQAPTAAFKAKPAFHGASSSFDGSASTTPNGGTITSWMWSFGDGTPAQTTTTPTVSHTYTKAGSYTVTLVVTDSSGVSTRVVSTAHQLLRNGGSSAHTQLAVTIK